MQSHGFFLGEFFKSTEKAIINIVHLASHKVFVLSRLCLIDFTCTDLIATRCPVPILSLENFQFRLICKAVSYLWDVRYIHYAEDHVG